MPRRERRSRDRGRDNHVALSAVAGSFKDTHRQHVDELEEHSMVDVGFHGLVTNAQQVTEIPRLWMNCASPPTSSTWR